MGQDYSYTQPSSSSASVDITSLLEEECRLYADEAEIRHWNAEAIHHETQPEGDDGSPTRCLCGAELMQLKGEVHESVQKVIIVQKTVSETEQKVIILEKTLSESKQKVIILEKKAGAT